MTSWAVADLYGLDRFAAASRRLKALIMNAYMMP
jgi:hypothetical protein